MSLSEESSLFSLEQGCPIHGDEYLRECNMCGYEFCRKCNPGRLVCPDCASQTADDEDEELKTDPDFEDVSDLKELLDEDEEADGLVETEEEIPPEDLEDEGRP